MAGKEPEEKRSDSTLLKILEAMQNTQNDLKEMIKSQNERIQNIENGTANGTGNTANTSMTRLIGDLDKRIPKFTLGSDSETSFAEWYDRYEYIFIIEGKALDDQSRLRLLTEKLEQEPYKRFESHILPKQIKDLKFEEAVKILKDMFDDTVSIFSKQYSSWTSDFDKNSLETDQAYGDRINEQFHKYMGDLDVEGYKILRFLVGLKCHEDQEHLPFLLSYANKAKKENATLKLQDIISELKNLRTYKKESQMISKTNNNSINQVTKPASHHYKRNSNGKYDSNHGQDDYQRSKSQGNRSKTSRCAFCKKIGHNMDQCYKKHPNLARYGRASPNSNKKDSRIKLVTQKDSEESLSVAVNAVRRYTDVIVNGTPLILQSDTGADVTILDRNSWIKMGQPELQPISKQFFMADKSELPCLGKLSCNFVLKDKKFEGDAYIIEDGSNLLGLEWMTKSKDHQRALNLLGYAVDVKAIANQDSIDSILTKKYPEVFKKGLGTCTKEKACLILKKEAIPKFCPPRPVPYASRNAVEKEIDRLLNMGVIEPINYSKWAAPIVCVKKHSGEMRVCLDFSTGLNQALEDNSFPLPLPDDIFARLNGGAFFSQIDLSDAYLQVELSEASKDLVVVHTHKGLYRYNRLPFGIKTAPAIFQNIMNKMCCGLEGVASYLDDILISGRTRQEHDKNLLALFERIAAYGFRLKLEKCSFHKEEIRFLGYIVSKEGRRPDPEKISALVNMEKPDNLPQLKSFLGMISYYGIFLAGVKRLRGPLDQLTHKDQKWNWDNKCDKAFDELIKLLSSDLNLCHFNPDLPIIVSADACDYGIGGVISHRLPNGDIRPIHHTSQALTAAEKNYSQIEKEGLALVTSVKKFHKYLYGRKFLLQTDHKPLLAIFGSKKGLPMHTQNRLLRWGTILLGYNFSLEYVKTDKFGQADGLSRLMSSVKMEDEDVVIAQVELDINGNFNEAIRSLPLLAEHIAKSSTEDKIISQVLRFVKNNNWPNYNTKMDPGLKPFFEIRHQLSIIEDCLIFGDKIVIPIVLRPRVLKELHRGHPGIHRMKLLAKNFVYWPGLTKDIEFYVRTCTNCQKAAKTDRKVPLNPWPTPSKVWQRIHIDYAGPVDGSYFLIVVDSLSRWPEIIMTKSITATATVKIMESILARNGLPETIVSDNGTQFASKEFATLCRNNGITHIFTSPYHPQSNGKAERFVDSFKRGCQKLKGEEGRIDDRILNKFLLSYRTTPCPSLQGKTPAEIFTGRKLRTTLSLLLPSRSEHSDNFSSKMKYQFDKKHGVKEKSFDVGDPILYKKHHYNGWTWINGKIIAIKGKANYLVEVEGKTYHAHANQLKRQLDQESTRDSPWLNSMMHTFNVFPRIKGIPDTISAPTSQDQEDQGRPESPVKPTTTTAPDDRQQAAPPLRRSSRPRRAPDRLLF